jgi:hypothetical protein
MAEPRAARQASLRDPRPLVLAIVPVVLLLVAGFSSGCRGDESATLSDLTGVEQLKARFNRDAGKPRIVLLLSPT